jgi:protein required for attachment to host cells
MENPMQLPKGSTVAVADGEKLVLFRNAGDEANPELTLLPAPDVDENAKGTSGGHQSSSANPDASQVQEDGFAAGVVELLNKQALTGKMADLVIIAAPRTLGEMRKHYHSKLSAMLIGEISKDLTGHSVADIQKAIANA